LPCCCYCCRSLDSTFDIATTLRKVVRGTNPGKGKRFSILLNRPDRIKDPPIHLPMCTGVPSRGQSGWGVTMTTHLHLEPRLQMGGAINLLPIRLHDVGRDFAYYYYYYYYIMLSLLRQGIYNYIPETNYVSRIHSVAAAVYLPSQVLFDQFCISLLTQCV
jgi:hypothetical protein